MHAICHPRSENFSDAAPQSLRLYHWIPRTEVGFLQAVVDASEGLARLRTEKHDGDRSLVFFVTNSSRHQELDDLLRLFGFITPESSATLEALTPPVSHSLNFASQ